MQILELFPVTVMTVVDVQDFINKVGGKHTFLHVYRLFRSPYPPTILKNILSLIHQFFVT